MLLVSLILIILGSFVSSQLFLGSGLLILFAIPFFMAVITLREKKRNVFFAVILLLFPLICSLFISCFMLPNNIQFLSEVEKSVSQMKLNSAFEMSYVKEFLSYSSWQRMLWFVFGAGSFSLFASFLISFANLACVDFAFEQVDKLKAVIHYVIKNHSQFSFDIVKLFVNMPMARLNHQDRAITVINHAKNESEDTEKATKWSGFFKPLKKQKAMKIKEYTFFFQEDAAFWNLKNFTLPFPLVLISIASMASIIFWFGNFEQIILATNNDGYFAGILACVGVLSLAMLSILTLQGMYTFYTRLSSFLALFFFFCIFILGSNFSFGPYVLIAVFGTISILDNVYDWRGRKI